MTITTNLGIVSAGMVSDLGESGFEVGVTLLTLSARPGFAAGGSYSGEDTGVGGEVAGIREVSLAQASEKNACNSSRGMVGIRYDRNNIYDERTPPQFLEGGNR